MRSSSRTRFASRSSGFTTYLSKANPWIALGLGCMAGILLTLCLVAVVGGLLLFDLQIPVPRRSHTIRLTRTPVAVGDAVRPITEVTPVQSATESLPAIPTPTSGCGQPTLKLGAAQFRIQSIFRAADGSLVVPLDTPEVAYWLEGTNTNHVFGLSPTVDNLALPTTLQPGDEAVLIWADCRSEAYVVTAVETSQANDSSLFDQATAGMTVFVQTDPGGAGLIIRGGPAEVPAITTDMPLPPDPLITGTEVPVSATDMPPSSGPSVTETEVLVIATSTPPPPGTIVREAEVSFLEKAVSADGQSLQVGISILNYGAAAFTVSAGDVSLTPENAAPLAPLSTEPALPREVGPGATETFYFTFPQPASGAVVFKIFDAEFDLEDF